MRNTLATFGILCSLANVAHADAAPDTEGPILRIHSTQKTRARFARNFQTLTGVEAEAHGREFVVFTDDCDKDFMYAFDANIGLHGVKILVAQGFKEYGCAFLNGTHHVSGIIKIEE